MTSIVDFIEARLAEDEEAARSTLIDVNGSGDWRADERPIAFTVDLYRVRDVNARPVVEAVKSLYGDEGPAEPLYVDGEAIAAHIARHDPARVLREVAAKRRVMERHCLSTASRITAYCDWCPSGDDTGYPEVELEECPELRDLAAPYSDHPDYNPEWSTT